MYKCSVLMKLFLNYKENFGKMFGFLIFCSLVINSGFAVVLGEDGFAYWGPADFANNTSIRRFTFEVANEDIDDLTERLDDTRAVVPPLDGAAFTYGFNTNELNSWIQYWRNNYSFTDRFAVLNQFSQYKTDLQGLEIHFIREEPKDVPEGTEVIPILLIHGWPGTVRELFEPIKLLSQVTGKPYVFDIIAPSLPGFAFSDAPVRPGCGAPEMADLLRNLMQRLNIEKYVIYGTDWGAIIGQDIATKYPEEVIGYYTNFAVSRAPTSIAIWFAAALQTSLVVDPELEDRAYPVLNRTLDLMREIGYLHLQASKPDSLSVAMSDSPAGLLAYVLQMISSGSRKDNVNKDDGGLYDLYTREDLLDIISLIWFTNSFTTSTRIYSESINTKMDTAFAAKPTPVPTRVIQAKDEMIYMSPPMLKFKFPQLLNAKVLDDGGHFLSMEMPQVLVDDVVDSVDEFRSFKRSA